MPIISNFPSGGGSGGGGLQLAAVSGIVTKVSHGKVYVILKTWLLLNLLWQSGQAHCLSARLALCLSADVTALWS